MIIPTALLSESEGFPKLANSDSLLSQRMEAGMAGIAITRTEFTATEMRAAAGKTKHARAARRMLAIALVIEGANRKTAADLWDGPADAAR
jgi:hypothetical protein